MNYYQITADIEEFDDEEDDPNWLVTTVRQPTHRQTSQTAEQASQMTLDQASPNETSAVSNSVAEESHNGVSRCDESVDSKFRREMVEPFNDVSRQNESTQKVVLRRQKPNQNNSKENPNRTSFYRLSRLIEGVASYVSTKPLPEEDSFHNGEQNDDHSKTSHSNGHDESPSSVDSGFESIQSRPNDVDPIDAKITEIFESIESVPVSVPEQARVVRRRRQVPDHPEGGQAGFFQRRKQTVSAYFSDWARWITNVEDEDPFQG